jgi:hypothetical protein
MEPKPQGLFDTWRRRCKMVFFAGIAVGAVRLAVLGVPPEVDASSPTWARAAAWVFDVARLILRGGLAACWIGMLLNSGGRSASERRGLFVFTAWFLTMNLALSLPEDAPVSNLLLAALSVTNLALTALMIWYMARSVGEETQKQIDAKLGIKRAKPPGAGRVQEA